MEELTTINSVMLLFVLLIDVLCISGCRVMELSSNELGQVRFHQLPIKPQKTTSLINEHDTGRPLYISEVGSEPIYLFHSFNSATGFGRWVINKSMNETDEAMAYVNSWAILPNLINKAMDNSIPITWFIPSINLDSTNEGWEIDSTIDIHCVQDDDRTVFFESSSEHQRLLSGFYVERFVSGDDSFQGIVYSQIKPDESSLQQYLYQLPNSNTWMIGESYGQDHGLAYVEDEAKSPDEITNERWNYVSSFPPTEDENYSIWEVDSGILYARNGRQADIYSVVRTARFIKYLPEGQGYLSLRNEVRMPLIGLGTGGLSHEESPEIFTTALQLGYRLFDLAREYGNEPILGEILSSIGRHNKRVEQKEDGLEPSSLPLREEIFIETKVWPTDLGFEPTTHAITESLHDLGVNYIDLYLLHWPRCEESIEWMHCHTTVDPGGTWKESWRALERAYAECRVQSIGVSNFDVQLLDELKTMANMLPHLIQNFAEVGQDRMDLYVRDWCKKHYTIYQPYAALRNMAYLHPNIQKSLTNIAHRIGLDSIDIPLVISKFMLQTSGLVMIPRSRNMEHLRKNLLVDSTEWFLTDEEMNSLDWNTNLNVTPTSTSGEL